MIFTNEVLIRSVILILGVFGFFVAKHIYNHKTKNTPLVCMVGFDCHTVVHSDYSRFLGIRVEILGMIYYVLTALTYLLFIFAPQFVSYTYIPLLDASILMIVSLAAFLFSAYLIGVQIFILKKGCSWCIVSALVCLSIFLIVFFA